METALAASFDLQYSNDGGGSFGINDFTPTLRSADTSLAAAHSHRPLTRSDGRVFGQRIRVMASSLAVGAHDVPSRVSDTLEVWVKVLDAGVDMATMVAEAATGSQLVLHDTRLGVSSGIGHMGAGVRCSSLASGAGPPPIGRWVHVVAVFDSSGAGTASSVYVDGVLAAAAACDELMVVSGSEDPATLPPAVTMRVTWANASAVMSQTYDQFLAQPLDDEHALFSSPSAAQVIGLIQHRPLATTATNQTVTFLFSIPSDPTPDGYYFWEVEETAGGNKRLLSTGPDGPSTNPEWRSHVWESSDHVTFGGGGGPSSSGTSSCPVVSGTL